jgi:diguanylate cyclase (GGDEF)-like protein/PAS domain S-box-containing protein
MDSPKILAFEDEKVLAVEIINRLQNLGYTVPDITDSGKETIKTVAETHRHLVFIDICLLGKINEVQMADIQNNFDGAMLYLTKYSLDPTLHEQQLIEPFSYILKPIADRDLHTAVEMAFYKQEIKNKLEEKYHQLTATINSMGCGVVVTDTNGCVQIMNPLAEKLTGWKQDEAVGKDLTEVFSLIDNEMNEPIGNLAKQAIKADAILNLPENCTLIAKDGTQITIGDNIAPIRDDDGKITGAVLVFQDISKRKHTEAQLLRNAFYDGLTALPNRILFIDRLRQAIERSKRRNDYHFAVLFLDLDGFKAINDRFGHGMGDNFLVAIARRLESCLRSGDTVARFGGDEFAILLEEIKDVSDATNIAKRIHESLALPLNLDGHDIICTGSIGIALSGSKHHEPESLLRDADIAMYRAKHEGKARYGIFDEGITR